MAGDLVSIITSDDPRRRDQSLDAFCRPASAAALLEACDRLDRFRRESANLYQRVRALFFLSAIYRYHLPEKLPAGSYSLISYRGYMHLLNRRFDEAIDEFLHQQRREA